jgi:hypothetical protein
MKDRQGKKQRAPRQCSEWTIELYDKLEEPEDRYLNLSESVESDDEPGDPPRRDDIS